jgi:hypothetical protein
MSVGHIHRGSLARITAIVIMIGGLVCALTTRSDLESVSALSVGSIAGYVRLESRTNFGSIQIRFADRTALTRADGGFAILDAPSGTYDVTAAMPGFLRARRAESWLPRASTSSWVMWCCWPATSTATT